MFRRDHHPRYDNSLVPNSVPYQEGYAAYHRLQGALVPFMISP